MTTVKEEYKISEEEALRAFLTFRSFSSDKQAFAIAFINGMELQRKLDKAEKQEMKVKKEQFTKTAEQ